MRSIRSLLLFTLTIILLIACSAKESEFEASMRLGREYLKDKDYPSAIEQFELAVIEQPTDKDALALLEMARTGSLQVRRINFLAEIGGYADELENMANKFNEEANNVSIMEAESMLPHALDIQSKLMDQHYLWKADPEFNTLTTSLHQASNPLIYALEAIIENIEEPLVIKGDGLFAKRRAEITSNDSIVRAKVNMQNFELSMGIFRSEFLKHQVDNH